jgi:hypothetical protein
MKISKQSVGKKFTLIICLAVLSNLANAQLRSYIDFNDYNSYENNLGTLLIDNEYKNQNVKEVVTINFDKKNRQLKTKGIYKLNKNGIGYFYQSIDKKGKIKLSRTYHLIDTFRFDKMESAYRNDTFTTVNIFNNNNKISEIQYIRNPNKMYWSYKYTYNEKNKITSSVSLNKKGKQYFKYEFDYYDNGGKKETRYYNKKNKLAKIYSYACEPTGVIEKKVTQQNICKKRTYNPDSSYFEIFEGHDNKGHSSRRIGKYSKDSLQLELVYYNKHDKETIRYVSVYKDKKVVTLHYFRNGNLKKMYYLTYKTNGLTESYKITNAKGKVKTNQVYEYQYF